MYTQSPCTASPCRPTCCCAVAAITTHIFCYGRIRMCASAGIHGLNTSLYCPQLYVHRYAPCNIRCMRHKWQTHRHNATCRFLHCRRRRHQVPCYIGMHRCWITPAISTLCTIIHCSFTASQCCYFVWVQSIQGCVPLNQNHKCMPIDLIISRTKLLQYALGPGCHIYALKGSEGQ